MNQSFSTCEISLAAALLSGGFKLEYMARDKGRERVKFVFLSSDNVLHLVQQFWQKQLLVNVHSYYENLKFLKARLRNETRDTRD